jgi:uncharacterized protein YoxC
MEEFLIWLLGVAGFSIVILIGAVGFFFKDTLASFKSSIDNVAKSVDGLAKSMRTELNDMHSRLDTNERNLAKLQGAYDERSNY